MAVAIIKDNGYIGIPYAIDWEIKDGETLYVMNAHGSGKFFITKKPLHQVKDREGIDRSPKLYCKVTANKRRIKITEDVIKSIFEGNGATGKVQVIKGFTQGYEDVLFLSKY